ncbi:hypothetical protein ACJRO7_030452 [Eucalyptus globulus]|uniref:glutathione transferase n=1 Tax=Eucalyptus globulus TaxID=34317 RepID=A0ABD3JE97_EUCGL
MARKIYGSVHSTAMMRALAVLHEKGLEFQLVPLDMRAGEHKKEPSLALNPFGQVPAFEDGDLKLFESRAITQYIARKYADIGTPLILESKPTVKVSASMEFKVHPETMESNMQWELMPDRAADAAVIENMMAMVNMWTEVEAHQFDPVASRLQRELVYRQMIGMAPDTAAFGENWTKLTELLDIYEARLSQSKYLGCDFFTLADLHHLPALTNLMGTPVKALFDARPNVSAWAANITARPAWVKVLALRNQY